MKASQRTVYHVYRSKECSWIILQQLRRAITKVYIDIHHSNALETPPHPGVDHGDGCIVQQTESGAHATTRAAVSTCVMTRWTGAYKDIGVLTAHGDVYGTTRGSSRAHSYGNTAMRHQIQMINQR